MTINRWSNGARVDTRKTGKGAYEVVIYPPEGGNPAEAAQLYQTLRAQGYVLNPVRIDQGADHSLRVTGFADPADAERTAEKLRKSIHKRGKENVSVTVRNGELTVTGLTSQVEVEGFQRFIASRNRRSKDLQIDHRADPKPPLQALHVSGVKEEKTLFSDLEKANWAKGERKDEYSGMNPLTRRWQKMVKSATAWGGFIFMLGDAQAMFSGFIDARRQGVNPLTHPAMVEGVGYGIGSVLMVSEGLLSQPASVQDVVTRIEDNFKVGGHFDFSRAEGFNRNGTNFGRGVNLAKDYIRSDGVELVMAANTLAGWGAWQARHSGIAMTHRQGDARNVVLDEATGERRSDRRFLWNYAISGALLMTAVPLMWFVPKFQGGDPYINYPAIGDKIRGVPVLGGLMNGAERFFNNTAVGEAVSWPFRKAYEWMSGDPYRIGANAMLIHNVQQIVFGLWNRHNRRQERGELEHQFKAEGEQLAAGIIPPMTVPVIGADGKPVLDENKHPRSKPLTLSPLEEEEVRKALAVIYNLDRNYDPKDPRYEGRKYKPDDPRYKPVPDDRQNYKDYIFEYEEKLKNAASRNKITNAERYIAIKAYTRQYLADVHQELRTANWKFASAITMIVASRFLAHMGEGEGLANQAEATVNPFAVMDGVAKTLKREGVDDAQLYNVAKCLAQDEAIAPYGFSHMQIVDILRAKMEGHTHPLEQQAAQGGLWDAVFREQARQTVPGQNVADVSTQEARQAETQGAVLVSATQEGQFTPTPSGRG